MDVRIPLVVRLLPTLFCFFFAVEILVLWLPREEGRDVPPRWALLTMASAFGLLSVLLGIGVARDLRRGSGA